MSIQKTILEQEQEKFKNSMVSILMDARSDVEVRVGSDKLKLFEDFSEMVEYFLLFGFKAGQKNGIKLVIEKTYELFNNDE